MYTCVCCLLFALLLGTLSHSWWNYCCFCKGSYLLCRL